MQTTRCPHAPEPEDRRPLSSISEPEHSPAETSDAASYLEVLFVVAVVVLGCSILALFITENLTLSTSLIAGLSKSAGLLEQPVGWAFARGRLQV